MRLLTRRLIFYTLTFFFFILGPLMVAYTAGYRWSFTQRRLVKTGAMLISTAPEGMRIALNGAPIEEATPALLTNLIPGTYTIVLSKEGYHRWQKTLTVQSARVTFAQDIVIFKKTEPVKYGGAEKPLALSQTLPSFEQFKIFKDHARDQIVVIDNELKERIAEIPGRQAVWRKGKTPLLLTYSPHEVWQWNPQKGTRLLITRLLEEIVAVTPLANYDTVLIILKDRVRALELDLRDRQNFWDLATFDAIEKTALSEDGKTLYIFGTREGKRGTWRLEL